MVDKKAASSIEKADRARGATYSEHEVLLFTGGNDDDDNEARIGKDTNGKISGKREFLEQETSSQIQRSRQYCEYYFQSNSIQRSINHSSINGMYETFSCYPSDFS